MMRIKVLIPVILMLSMAALAVAQETASDGSEAEKATFSESFNSSGDNTNTLLTWIGYSNYLYTYTDRRWVDSDDQGDYITAPAIHGGVEMVFSGLSGYESLLSDISAGFSLGYLYQGTVDPVTLYAVPLQSIPEETFPSEQIDRVWQFKMYPGFFAGIDRKWYAVDLGMTLEIWAYNEEVRRRRDASNTIVEEEGRGLLWGDMSFLMNFYARLGMKEKGYFDISFMRQDYNPVYGMLVYRVVVPISQLFTLKAGGYWYPASSVFVEPVLRLGEREIGVKIGSIVNYYDDGDIQRIPVLESLFFALSYSSRW